MDMLLVGVTVLGGAGSITVLYRYTDTVREAQQVVLQTALVLVPGAVVVGVVAPVFDAVFAVDRLQLAAGLAVAVIAFEFFDVRVGRFTAPSILVTGFLLSFQGVSGVALTAAYVLPAAAAAGAAVLGLFAATYLHRFELDTGVVRWGGGIVLLCIAVSLFGFHIPAAAAVTVFAGTLVVAAVPDAERERYRNLF